MKAVQNLSILFLILFAGCTSTNEESTQHSSVDTTTTIQNDTLHLPKTGELYTQTPEQMEESRMQDIADSINMLQTLEKALKIAYKQKDKEHFNLESDTLNIRYGHIFSSSIKHLIVTRIFQYGISTDIYKLQKNNFVKVCSKNMASLAYIGDTIQDVNGDKKADFLFHWYPMSGCCIRDVYDVFLQKPNGDFADEVEFINPNFSAKEKIIRGHCYGYDAPLYKYKWNGYNVDTIEYIYFPDSTNGNHFIRRKQKDEKGEIIQELPGEYKAIGYEK